MRSMPAGPQAEVWPAARQTPPGLASCIGRVGLAALVILASLVSPAQAQDLPERERIAAERRQVEANFNAAQAACQGRFLLTQCLDQAREERRLAMDSLQRRQLEIDDLARRERSAQRLQAVQQRALAARAASGSKPGQVLGPAAGSASGHSAALPAELPQASAPSRRNTRPQAEPASAPWPAATPGAAKASPAAAVTAATAQRAQRSQADYQRRQNEAAAHRAAVQARNQRQDADRPPATGLPVPAAPAAAPRAP